ncbi:beta/gamma crystallin domain-containing protein [Paenarthrobacter sp. YAF11_1]|uniref:beta/gamma crystallin domain-containing protein n=1 Tax=Paenarthrobacter sp. YAF11_1 TaxID=3233074 RepID=UPI003F982FF1
MKDFVLRGASLGEVKKFYPATTAAEVKAIKREAAAQPQLRITNPICNNVDFYSIVRGADSKEWCFANAGSMSFYMPGITALCPGNNNGNVTYQASDGNYYISPRRGPVTPRTTCFYFSGAVTVTSVAIY